MSDDNSAAWEEFLDYQATHLSPMQVKALQWWALNDNTSSDLDLTPAANHPCPDMSCPHCPCTHTAECCHCGDGQVHK